MLSLLLSAGLVGCAPTVITNDPVADAYAAEFAQLGSFSLRLAAGSGALAAYYCATTQDEWIALSETDVSAPDEISALLGLPPGGKVIYSSDSGAVTVNWDGVEIDDGIPGRVVMEIRRAMETFSFSFTPEGAVDEAGDPILDPEAEAIGFIDALASVTVSDCGVITPGAVSLALSYDMPSTPQLDEDGVEIDGTTVSIPYEAETAVSWTPGALWPDAGDYAWTLGAGSTRQRLLGYDAAEIGDDLWPSQAEGRDWLRDVDVPLTRGVR